MKGTLSTRGNWPGAVVFRAGWSIGQARPWNDDLDIASLRIDRGTLQFLSRCTEWLLAQGAPAVASIPLHRSSKGMWDEAGFRPFRLLRLMERDLSIRIPEPKHVIRVGDRTDLESAFEIDQESFEIEWRIGHLGLEDSLTATPRSRVLLLDNPDPVGYAVIGLAGSTSYLQRIAVRPAARQHGFGRSLVRRGMQWAKERGARTMILNTQNDNEPSTALYRSEGFESLPEPLHVLRYSRNR